MDAQGEKVAWRKRRGEIGRARERRKVWFRRAEIWTTCERRRTLVGRVVRKGEREKAGIRLGMKGRQEAVRGAAWGVVGNRGGVRNMRGVSGKRGQRGNLWGAGRELWDTGWALCHCVVWFAGCGMGFVGMYGEIWRVREGVWWMQGGMCGMRGVLCGDSW